VLGVSKKVVSAVELTRLSMAFGAVTDLWLIVILSRTRDEYHYMPVASMPLTQALICTAITAVGLFSFAAALNDLLDARHDRIFSPHRPIASGDIGSGQAFTVALASLLLALAGVIVFGQGALVITLLLAGGTLFYNGTAKFIPGVGLLTIGILHAAHMLIPNDQFTFTLPAWLAMTHATAVATIMHFVQSKRPALSRRAFWMLVLGWLICSVVIIGWGISKTTGSFWPETAPAYGPIFPLLAIGTFILVVVRKIKRAQSPMIAAEKIARYGALWQSLYAAAWLFSWGEFGWGIIALAVAGIGFGAMTLLKEIGGSIDQPITYRG